jgi:probable phosphoglycerate mutase
MLDELHARHLVGVEGVREVWLIRHADAYAGMAALAEGRLDPPLSQRGHEQAARLAARLASVPLDAVWASDLRRARETAEAIVHGRPLQVRVDARLGEVRTHWDEGHGGGVSGPGTYPFPEPEAEVTARMGAAVADVVAELEGAAGRPPRAALVSHNGAIVIYVASLLGLGWGQLYVLAQFTSITVLAAKDDRVVVQSIADATHLVGLGPAHAMES